MTKDYDLVVLGGGTGGYVAAIRAVELGMKVAVVEHQKVGGTCLHEGCIPSKALLRSAEMFREMKNAATYGITTGDISLDFTQVQERKKEIVDTLHTGVKSLLKNAKIDVYHGYGRILGPSIFSPLPGTISVEYDDHNIENTMLVPKYLLIATGSRPKAIPGLHFDGELILNSDDALQLNNLPSSILIIGAGVIGIEWASMLTDFGVDVTVIESANDILINEDKDVRTEIKRQLIGRGVTFKTGASIQTNTLKKQAGSVTIKVETNGELETITTEKMLISIGRIANIEGIGLNNTSVQVNKGFIKTNERYQTKESHIYAIGDCIGGLQLAHVATHEGKIAAEQMAQKKPLTINAVQVPQCIYAHPEMARVGLTEDEAISQGYKIKKGKIPMQAIGKAHVHGDVRGFAKIITDKKTDDLLGIHLVGAHATELISEASLATMLDASAWEIGQTIHAHPTLAEVFAELAATVTEI